MKQSNSKLWFERSNAQSSATPLSFMMAHGGHSSLADQLLWHFCGSYVMNPTIGKWFLQPSTRRCIYCIFFSGTPKKTSHKTSHKSDKSLNFRDWNPPKLLILEVLKLVTKCPSDLEPVAATRQAKVYWIDVTLKKIQRVTRSVTETWPLLMISSWIVLRLYSCGYKNKKHQSNSSGL